jgi:hypothetical protein
VKRTFAPALAGLACLLLAPALRSQTEPLQASRDGRSWVLTAAQGSARLETPDGRSLVIPLPKKAQVTSLAALDGGWAAAGSFEDGDGIRKIFVLRGSGTASRALSVPPGQEDGRYGPVLLAAEGRLAGLAWLEGDGPRSLAVRASAWSGARWEAPVAVSRPGPGSQLALTGAVLADGSWLLAWSAFDGQDDEIVWSRRAPDGAWSKAQRVAPGNEVPDIVPALTATGNGALLSWNRYDGEGYRLLLARFSGGAWRDERTIAPAGSLYPSFVDEAGRPALVYLSVVQPRAWAVLEMDASGRVLGRAAVPSSLDRPVVGFEASEVRMRWPAAAREAAAPLERKTP